MNHVRTMRMAARSDFVGDAANFYQRGGIFRLRHEGSPPLHARQDLLGRQLTHSTVDRHSRNAKVTRQLVLRRYLIAFFPFARVNPAKDVILDFLVRGGVHAATPMGGFATSITS